MLVINQNGRLGNIFIISDVHVCGYCGNQL